MGDAAEGSRVRYGLPSDAAQRFPDAVGQGATASSLPPADPPATHPAERCHEMEGSPADAALIRRQFRAGGLPAQDRLPSHRSQNIVAEEDVDQKEPHIPQIAGSCMIHSGHWSGIIHMYINYMIF